MQNQVILQIKDLSMGFESRSGITPILDQVNLTVHKNEIVAIVGESGCGKTVTAKSIMRLLPSPPAKYTSGQILFSGADMLKIDEKHLRSIRGDRISMIFQEPLTSLNPVLTIGDQIEESFRLHRKDMNKAQIREATIELLKKVRIPAPKSRLKNYPGQFSGGMRQRIMIAMAIACNPELLIADEPTTALDVTIQAQILNLIKQINRDTEMSCILITHDLGVVAEFAQRILVMYAGQPIEQAETIELFGNPRHPYTRGLLASLPKMGEQSDRLHTIAGNVPSPNQMPKGCRFCDRCTYAQDKCREQEPAMREIQPGHICKCHFAESLTEERV